MDGFEGKENPSSLARFELRIVQPVASLYTYFQQESTIVHTFWQKIKCTDVIQIAFPADYVAYSVQMAK